MKARLLRIAAVGMLLAGVPPSTPASAVAANSTVVISQGVDADTLDPLLSSLRPSINVQLQMFDTLLRFDRNGHLQPRVATSFSRIKPNVWEFKLRHDVRFWNGDPLTSTDVRFSIEKIMDHRFGSSQAPRFATVASVSAPDPYTLDIETKRPTPQVPAYPWLTAIVDAKYWNKHDPEYLADHPMGSGPYVFKRWIKSTELDLKANHAYWGGRPPIEHAIFKPIASNVARVAALRSKAVDLITNVPPADILLIGEGASSQTKIEAARSNRVLFIAINTKRPGPQNDVHVRQALNYAVNVPEIVQNVLLGHGYPLNSPIPVSFIGHDSTLQGYSYDPQRARELLAPRGLSKWPWPFAHDSFALRPLQWR